MLLDFTKKLNHQFLTTKIPFVFLMLLSFSLWNYFLNQDPDLSEVNQVELSSKEKPVKKINPNLYITNVAPIEMNGDSPNLAFEDPEQCGKDRLYLEKDISNIGEVFRKQRNHFPEAKIPMECILYSMKSFMYSPRRNSIAYSYCSDDKGTPPRGKRTACLTKDYVNSIYNAYVDVMDCLAIPQTDLIPKLLNESGFHANTLGYGMDAGVGQLTGDAIKSVLQMGKFGSVNQSYLKYYVKEMEKSKKDSCDRVLSNMSLVSAVSPKQDQRCSLIALPENPLRNILYTGIFYRYILQNQTGILYANGENFLLHGDEWVPWTENSNVEYGGYIKSHKIEEKLAKAGLVNPNMNAIKQMLITLGYNSGMQTAVIFLDNYIKARIAAKLPLQPIDFDFLEENFNLFRSLKNPKAEQLRMVKEARIMREPFRASFPVYLRIVQKVGTPGYLSLVAMKHKQLNSAFGESKCTSQKYLQF